MDPAIYVISFLMAAVDLAIAWSYIYQSIRLGHRHWPLPIVGSATVGMAIAAALGPLTAENLFFSASFAIVFSMLPFYYASRSSVRLPLFIAVIAVLFVAINHVTGTMLYSFIRMFAVGTAFGIMYKEVSGHFKASPRLGNAGRRLEVKRDMVHIFAGLVIMAVFLLLDFYTAIYLVMALIMLGYIYNGVMGLSRSGLVFSVLRSFERPASLYGSGALYLGIGTAILIGFIHNFHFLMIGIIALLLADPVATIVGIKYGRRPLFYNRRKSVEGLAAFFLVVAVLGYAFVGYFAILFGAFLAVVESVDMRLDDNLAIPLFMVALYIIYLAANHMLPLLY